MLPAIAWAGSRPRRLKTSEDGRAKIPADFVVPHRAPFGPCAVMPAYERYAEPDVRIVPETCTVEIVAVVVNDAVVSD